MKLFWPEKPCQPSLVTQAGSTRPVEPPALSPAGQSGFAQYLAPGTRKAAGTEFSSAVFARNASLVVEGPHGALVVDHMRPGVLETRAIRFNDIPTEQREDLVESRVA